MNIQVGKQFLKIKGEPPFEVVVNGQVAPGGLFDRFHQAVEIRERLDGPLKGSKTSKSYPLQLPPPFHFAAVVSDRRRYPLGSRVYLIQALEKGVEYQQHLMANGYQTLWERRLKVEGQWHVECLEGLEPGDYSFKLVQGKQFSIACFRVLPLGPPRQAPIAYRMIHHYGEKVWARRPLSRDDPYYSFDFNALNDPCEVEIASEATLEYHENGRLCKTIEGPDKRVPCEYFAMYAHRVARSLHLHLGQYTQQITAEDQSRPVYLGADHFAGKVAWPGARLVDGVYFSGSCAAVGRQVEATGICDEGPWLIRYSLEEDRESFQFQPPEAVRLTIRALPGELELQSPLAGQAVLVVSDPESAGASLSEPYGATLLSWFAAAAPRYREGPLQEVQLEATGNSLFLTGRGAPDAVNFTWSDSHDHFSSHAEPLLHQMVQVLNLDAHTPVRVPLDTRSPGRARFYLYAANRLHLEELQW
ncbi:hypothetical protein JST97_38670 [bacterium]|nr:hypothetical protein [bacterium]